MAETHEIVVMKPKPSPDEIIRLTTEYFNARGRSYDHFDSVTPKRDLFTERVDTVVGHSFGEHHSIQKVVSIACGTGRRELDISRIANRSIEFYGVEASPEMAQLARNRGLHVLTGSWPDVELPAGQFDAAIVLSALGHVPSEEFRVRFLAKIREALVPDAHLFFDVLNLKDQTEWGPRIEWIHAAESLQLNGFDAGDVMYRKIGEPEICFYHYFTVEEISSLLTKSGFKLVRVLHIGYGRKSGEVLSSEDGALLIEARKAG